MLYDRAPDHIPTAMIAQHESAARRKVSGKPARRFRLSASASDSARFFLGAATLILVGFAAVYGFVDMLSRAPGMGQALMVLGGITLVGWAIYFSLARRR